MKLGFYVYQKHKKNKQYKNTSVTHILKTVIQL